MCAKQDIDPSFRQWRAARCPICRRNFDRPIPASAQFLPREPRLDKPTKTLISNLLLMPSTPTFRWTRVCCQRPSSSPFPTASLSSEQGISSLIRKVFSRNHEVRKVAVRQASSRDIDVGMLFVMSLKNRHRLTMYCFGQLACSPNRSGENGDVHLRSRLLRSKN